VAIAIIFNLPGKAYSVTSYSMDGSEVVSGWGMWDWSCLRYQAC